MFPNAKIGNIIENDTTKQKRDMDSAKRYLSRAGNSPEAIYARGAYSAMVEDYATARTLLKQAEAAGIAQATETLKAIDTFVSNNK